MPIAATRVAWYVTGRFYAEGTALQDLGYFLYLSGLEAPLFTDPAKVGEATAVLTFRSEPFQAQDLTNGNLAIGLDRVGSFSVYLNPAGGASFDDPGSFSRGQLVATFQRASVVMGETLSSPLLGGLALSMNVFTADLVSSVPFAVAGVGYDFARALPYGLTQWGTASANGLATFSPYTRIVAFTGSAVAAGRPE